MRRKLWFALFPIAILAVACGGGDSTSGKGLTKVTLMLDWTPNTNHTGFYVARDKGWYKEAGLDVEIVEPASGGVGQVVGAGKVEFGVSNAEEVVAARAEGVPVVSISAIIQHNTSSFLSLTKDGITRPKDMAGKTYGGFGGPLEIALVRKLVSCDGGDPEKVKFVEVGNVDYLVGMERGQYNFVWIFDGWETIQYREVEQKAVSTIPLRSFQSCIPDWYSPLVITSESLMKQKPEVVRKFMDATARGFEYAISNPDDAAAVLLKAAPELDKQLVTSSEKYLASRYVDSGRQWGKQDADVWTKFEQFLRDAGLTTKKVDTSAAFSNDFLPKR